ncbi:RecQ family ATP-dependent DNA helicase [Gracilibacillus marinus]|jgi:ATP-dependent DNA helicase RecQ|uniref:RecQ family ATP-dependent DNA helicase n=1 Tax=Gracilibacillus marinus TaxID=630535 RepID=A0ABV8VY08_9BACI
MLENNLEKYLKKYFGYDSFREGQKEIIESVLQQQHTLAVLPTGSGKSICYQLPAMILNQLVIVVSPLLSLMTDQVKELKAFGMKDVAAMNSFISYNEKKYILNNLSKFRIVFCSPEMLQNSHVIKKLQTIQIGLFVIDEAHCLSQWGYDFRPDYLRLTEIHRLLNNPPILALSATATEEVRTDIINILRLKKYQLFVYPIDKANISYIVRKTTHPDQKKQDIVELLKQYPVPTMIYFSSRLETERISSYLKSELPSLRIAFYHGGLDTTDRIVIQQQFMANQLDIVCCTSAFGMGINKPDVRLVIHYHIPSQLESFIQEVGRCGRDGKSSVSVTLFHDSDKRIPYHLIQSELPDVTHVRVVLERARRENMLHVSLLEDIFLQTSDNNESQWRFLRYHLEQLHLIEKETIKLNNNNTSDFINYIEKIISSRRDYKMKKLSEMLDWIDTSDCRREKLFDPFQEEIQKLESMCCDQCGFNWDFWKPDKIKTNEYRRTWEQMLADKLLQSI